MSNDHNLKVAIAEHQEEQRRKQRGLMSDQFNLDCSSDPALYFAAPRRDPVTGQTIPSRPYADEEPRVGTERTRRSDKVSDPVNKTPRAHSHYFKDVSKYKEADVYRVCQMFDIKDPSGATQHAVKKLLLAGGRGAKDRLKDLREASDTIHRLIEMTMEDAA